MDNTTFNFGVPLQNIKSIKDYEQEIEALRNENFDLKSKMQHITKKSEPSMNEEIKKLLMDSQTSINILENENKKIKEECRIAEHNCEALKEENNKLIKHIEGITNEANNYQNDINIRNEDFSKMKENCEFLKNECDEKIKQAFEVIKEKEMVINDYKNRIDLIENENIEIRNEYEMRLKNISEENANLLNVQNEMKSAIEKQNKFIDEQNYRINEFNSAKENLENKIATLENIIRKRDGEMQNLEGECQKRNNMAKELEEAKINLKLYENENINIKNEYNKLKEKIKEYGNTYEQAKKIAMNGEKEKNQIISEYKKLEIAKNGLENKFNQLLQDRNKMENTIRDLNVEKNIKIEQYNNLLFEKNELESQIAIERQETFANKENQNNGNSEYIHMINTLQHNLQLYKNICGQFINFKNFINEKIKNFYVVLFNIEKVILEIQNKQKGQKNKFKKFKHIAKKKIFQIRQEVEMYKRKGQNLNSSPLLKLNQANIKFIKKISNSTDLNTIFEKFSQIYNNMLKKIEILEAETGQLTYFAENNTRNIAKKTNEMFDKFSTEFKSAREELDFCKDYLKKKGREIKNYKKENEHYKTRIFELENILKEKTNEKKKYNLFGMLG